MKNTSLCALLALALNAAAARALDSGLTPGADKEREAMLAQWKQTLEKGNQTEIEKTLAAATSKSQIAFGMSDWPQAVAKAALRSKAPLQELLLNHLREHRNLINQTTRDWIRDLFKKDVLDPAGEQVRGWVKAGKPGSEAATAALEKAAKSGRWMEVAEFLDAVARCGNDHFLPLAAAYLSSENSPAAQAALSVFKAHAKDLGPELRSPKLCQIWWLQSGKALFEAKYEREK
jgi:hypothetical protein